MKKRPIQAVRINKNKIIKLLYIRLVVKEDLTKRLPGDYKCRKFSRSVPKLSSKNSVFQ